MIKQLTSTLIIIACGLVVALSPSRSLAQDSPADDIENLFNKDDQDAPPSSASQSAATQQSTDVKNTQIKDVTDLQKLEEFKDVAVIQRRYLPKTGRFELFIGPQTTLNDAFFLSFGLDARFAYYFRERYGIELTGMYMTTGERSVTTELRDKLGVTARSFVTPKSYVGADFKWSPLYGKMTWLNKKITPFDLYFSLGVGSTNTNQGGSEPTLHLGTGQVFALSKASAVRWDFSWNFFSASSTVTGTATRSSYNNLYLSIGYSWFFPEATYR